jgi:predicted DNA-binding antitoxin AbrB/MazE fold protein
MPKVIQAVYENGVFKPVGKIDLQEHQQVEIVLSEMSSVTQKTQEILKGLDDDAVNDIALSPEFLPEECGQEALTTAVFARVWDNPADADYDRL